MTFARRQRTELLTKLRELGPFAETACEGWKTQDLAAHLYIREHKPTALPGIGSAKFADKTARIQMEALHTLGYEELLKRLAVPSLLMRPLDPIVGAVEWYIHHEDVLRPLGEKVQLSEKEQKNLLPIVKALALKTHLRMDTRLIVTPTIGNEMAFGKGDRSIHVEGAPSELLLHFSGRDSDVTIKGEDIDKYKEAIRGL